MNLSLVRENVRTVLFEFAAVVRIDRPFEAACVRFAVRSVPMRRRRDITGLVLTIEQPDMIEITVAVVPSLMKSGRERAVAIDRIAKDDLNRLLQPAQSWTGVRLAVGRQRASLGYWT